MKFATLTDRGLIISINVQPRSSKTMISGLYGNALKIKLTAPPIDGKANQLLIKFLSKTLKLPKSSITILTGETGRSKRLLIRSPKGGRGLRDVHESLKALAAGKA